MLRSTATIPWAPILMLALVCCGFMPWAPARAEVAGLVEIPGVPASSLRWRDVASNLYAVDYQAAYVYAEATVVLSTSVGGEPVTLQGRLDATNLKPNFAYQMKLEGKPTGIWGADGDDLANERIGYLGRWWREQPSPGNATDADYAAHHDDPGYIYKGYLLFDHFVTDRHGNAVIDFALDSSFHVLALNTQGSPDACDGGFVWHSVFGTAEDQAYDTVVGPTAVGVYALHEPLRPCAGEATLPVGAYNCRFLLTEESFHQASAGSGSWASVLSHDHLHFDLAMPDAGAHDYVDLGNPASEAGHALAGWGPTEPDFNGGAWGGIGSEVPPGRCRVIWSPSEDAPVENWASLNLDFGFSATELKCLRIRYLDGNSDDSFTVGIDDEVVLSVDAPAGGGEIWRWTSVDVTGYTGVHAVRFTATTPEGSYFQPYGQIAVDMVGLGSLTVPVPANDDPATVQPLACGDTRPVDIHYLRDCNHTAARGYSVRVRCPPGEDRLFFDDGDITVHVQPAGLESGEFVWQVYRAPDAAAFNDWTVDYVILGAAAEVAGGIPDQAVLFTVDLHGVSEGEGHLEVAQSVIGHLEGGPPQAIGTGSATLVLDCSGPTAVGPEFPPAPTLAANRPNPFNPSTDITFSLPAAQRVRLTIHALDGRLVAILMDAELPAGHHAVTWTGCDDRGRETPSGTYVCCMEADNFRRTVKMTLLK
ncbi:MAG: hypothetical protein Q7W56_02520 [Candidatus Latescibacteria bacterium]|nr:hypothetical protein [Candidatus Latescibacterota bacterium]